MPKAKPGQKPVQRQGACKVRRWIFLAFFFSSFFFAFEFQGPHLESPQHTRNPASILPVEPNGPRSIRRDTLLLLSPQAEGT
jgi:hypothetical protein